MFTSSIQLADPAAISSIALPPTDANGGDATSTFQSVFSGAVREVENLQQQADNQVYQVLSGQQSDIHTALIATEKADLSFELFMGLRSKLTSAYQTIMGAQI
jgi:flagellar hook-basal body complex protein FliE